MITAEATPLVESLPITPEPVEPIAISLSSPPEPVVPMYTMEELNLFATPLPDKTSSYSPVSHKLMITETIRLIDNAGYEILDKYYVTADGGKVLNAIYNIREKGTSSPYTDTISFQNSYNKRVKLKYAQGVKDYSTGATLLSEESNFNRKHTGAVVAEFQDVLDKTLVEMSVHRPALIENLEFMKEINIQRRTAVNIIAEVYFRDIINTVQMTNIKQAFNKIMGTSNIIALVSVYTLITKSMSQLHAAKQIESRINLFELIRTQFGIL